MLFHVNMYRGGHERRRAAWKAMRWTAHVTTVVALNAAVIGLFLCAIVLSDKGIASQRVRLETTQRALAQRIAEDGSAPGVEQLELARTRAAQVRWSSVLQSVARLTPPEMWLPRLRYADGYVAGAKIRVPGLRLTGQLRAGREEEGLRIVMSFIRTLCQDTSYCRHFIEPRLVDSTWLGGNGAQRLEFDIFCPVAGPEAIEAGLMSEMSDRGPMTGSRAPDITMDGGSAGNTED